tara:strand:- start:2245 stop:2637 length:393 start_codon:yes stop_codon:yes gene_type:complete
MHQLPIDIIRKIYKFDNTHRNAFDKTMERISLNGIHLRIEQLDDEYANSHMDGLGLDYTTLILRYFPDPENALKILNTCKCCERHQQKRPCKLTDEIPYVFPTNGDYEYKCPCKCRQISRFICRAHSDSW